MGYVPPTASVMQAAPIRTMLVGGEAHGQCCVLRQYVPRLFFPIKPDCVSFVPDGEAWKPIAHRNYVARQWIIAGERILIYCVDNLTDEALAVLLHEIAWTAADIPADFKNRFWIGEALCREQEAFDAKLAGMKRQWDYARSMRKLHGKGMVELARWSAKDGTPPQGMAEA